MKFKNRTIFSLLVVAALAAACEPKGGTIESMTLTVNDSGNYSGKWSSSSDLKANILKSGSAVSSGVRVSVQDASAGVLSLNLTDLERVEHTLVLYSPSSLSISAGQSASSSEIRLASASFTPSKKGASVSLNIASLTAAVQISVKNLSTDYSGWNLESIALEGPSALAGALKISGTSASLSGNESNEVLYEISSPSALRTKPFVATMYVYPALNASSKVKLTYNLEKDGKRVEICHTTSFGQTLSGGSSVTYEDEIPATLEGQSDWTVSGTGVKYTAVFPGKEWETATPESRGYSSSKLESLRAKVENMSTTSLMIAVGGKVIFSYGDVTENVRIASCRKSLLSTLYGKYVENGTIDLNKTLADLGIDEDEDSWGGSAVNWDGGALLESEKQATIKDLLTARSGCFHKPSNSGDDHSYMKASDRGKYTHGTYYLYNNWDFNCAGGVFEQLTGLNIYSAFKTDIADPCGWQDYLLSNQKKTVEYEGASRFPAYHFWISTRDMLRMALLMLNKGNWDGTQVVSEDWATQITTTYTKRADMHPTYRLTREFEYGWLWWTFCPQHQNYDASIFEGGFTATGSGGQYITALPALDMVIAHKDKNQNTEKSDYYALIKSIAACKNN